MVGDAPIPSMVKKLRSTVKHRQPPTKRAPSALHPPPDGPDRRAVLGPEPAAMGFDDLLGDRQAQAEILAEALLRPVGVEALEDLVRTRPGGCPDRPSTTTMSISVAKPAGR